MMKKFCKMSLMQEEFDIYSVKEISTSAPLFPKKRSRVNEIVVARSVVLALTRSGVCSAFCRETNQRLCFLNVSPDEVVRSIFYNKHNDSIITVSVYPSDNFSSLKCRSTELEYIKKGQPDAGFALFESEALKWPGFVEFDDVNAKVLTYSPCNSIYKVYDLKNYKMLYSIADKDVQEIKTSPGKLLLIFTRASSNLPLKILSIEDGMLLKAFNHLLQQNKKVEFVELFNEKLLLKQENEYLQILDVRNAELTEVNCNKFMTPSAFIFLYEKQTFLTFRDRICSVWNSQGELVASFDDHLLWHPDCNTNTIYITSDQDHIVSYCLADSEKNSTEGNAGSINISNIITGKCLAKVNVNIGGTKVANALKGINALFYDEDRNEIYTGNKQGVVHVWSNRRCTL